MAYTETSKGETKQNPEAEEDDSSPRAVLDIPIRASVTALSNVPNAKYLAHLTHQT